MYLVDQNLDPITQTNRLPVDAQLTGSNVTTLYRGTSIQIPAGLFFETPTLDYSKCSKITLVTTMNASQNYGITNNWYDDLTETTLFAETLLAVAVRGNINVPKKDLGSKRGRIRVTNADGAAAAIFNFLVVWGYIQ